MTELTPLPTGAPAPDFMLTDVLTGQRLALSDVMGHGVIVCFWSTDCAWSRYYDDYFLERVPVWAQYDLTLLFINSNNNESVQEMRDMADAFGINNPILHDADHAVADAYGAMTTPHVYLISPMGRVLYQGAVDDRSFRRQAPTVNYLDQAVLALASGQSPDPAVTPAYGCTIVRE
jgi:peroxiredoxin